MKASRQSSANCLPQILPRAKHNPKYTVTIKLTALRAFRNIGIYSLSAPLPIPHGSICRTLIRDGERWCRRSSRLSLHSGFETLCLSIMLRCCKYNSFTSLFFSSYRDSPKTRGSRRILRIMLVSYHALDSYSTGNILLSPAAIVTCIAPLAFWALAVSLPFWALILECWLSLQLRDLK